jgi:spermidine synthase
MGAFDDQTEHFLAKAVLSRIKKENSVRIMVGGLGPGLTLNEVLRDRP